MGGGHRAAGRWKKEGSRGPTMSTPMFTAEIIRKFTEEFNRGINTEVQVVCVLAEIRKQA